ncbi:MAG: hypothetical protein JXR73_06895 [Candidatus Omnitrophica bacterium]|nr:hypothetical protein [Candidatus Omnitrophota bacterium]
MKKFLLLVCVLLSSVSIVQSQSIFIVTDAPDLEEPGTGNLGDFLRDLGYSVTVDPGIDDPDAAGGNNSAFRGALSADQVATLESHDLVLFHRSTDSGQFSAGLDQWNGLSVPLLNGSSYTARDTRWIWVPNGNAPTDTVEYLFVSDPSHPIFTNVTIDDDGFVRLFDIDTPQDVNGLEVGGDLGNGKVVAETEFAFHTAIGVWDEPGEFFEGGSSHTNRVVFFALSRYFEDDGTGAIAFEHYSEDGLQLLANAVEYAIYGDVTGRTPSTSVGFWELH